MKTVASNRRAKFDYDILDTVEAGIVLSGQEVKSCRQGHVNLQGSYVSFLSGAAVLKNATIAPYTFASNIDSYEPGQDRKLLLSKKELEKIDRYLSEKGVAVLPLDVKAGRFIKVTLGVGRGRKKADKRQSIKDKEMKKRLKKGEEY